MRKCWTVVDAGWPGGGRRERQVRGLFKNERLLKQLPSQYLADCYRLQARPAIRGGKPGPTARGISRHSAAGMRAPDGGVALLLHIALIMCIFTGGRCAACGVILPFLETRWHPARSARPVHPAGAGCQMEMGPAAPKALPKAFSAPESSLHQEAADPSQYDVLTVASGRYSTSSATDRSADSWPPCCRVVRQRTLNIFRHLISTCICP